MTFALALRTTSISSYRILQEDFMFPSLLLEKISSGATETAKCRYIQNAEKISQNACLEKYFTGDTIFQICQILFKKNTLVLHLFQRITERSAITLQVMLQRKSRNISVVVVMNF